VTDKAVLNNVRSKKAPQKSPNNVFKRKNDFFIFHKKLLVYEQTPDLYCKSGSIITKWLQKGYSIAASKSNSTF
jgi:hypothetical protein